VTTKIILTRHGHVEGISPRRFRGRENVRLTDLGRAQAEATARQIAELWRPDDVFTSPMGRCVETAAAIANACGTASRILDSLIEIDYGNWQWKTHEEINRTFPELYARWRTTPHLFRFPQGETLQDLVARVADALRYVLQDHRDQTVVLVGHNTICRVLLMQVLDQPLSAYWRLNFTPCGVSEIEFVGDVPRVLRINETFHLPRGVSDGGQRNQEAVEVR
jgi:broad specificity phosphatase PhoE